MRWCNLRPAIFVRVHDAKLAGAVEQRLANNLFLGLGVPDARLADLRRGNFIASPTVLQDAEPGLYTLHLFLARPQRAARHGTRR